MKSTDTFLVTFKMVSISLKHEIHSKCRSLNSPVYLKKYSRHQKLRPEASDWDDWGKKSFEFNQSLVTNTKFASLEERGNMDSAAGFASGLNLIQLEKEPVSKQPQNPLTDSTCDASNLSNNLLKATLNHSTFGPNEPILPYVSNGRAIFTVHVPSLQILVVNSAACQLMNYNSTELCLMKLESLVIDSDKCKLLKLFETFQKSLGETNGKLLSLIKKDGEFISVSIYLKRLDNPEKCLAIVEPIDVKTCLLSVDVNGKILSCEGEIALIFQYDASECVGLSVRTLLPGIDLSKRNEEPWKELRKQYVTGRTKNGAKFPVSLAVSYGNSTFEYKIVIWMYPSLNGLILLNKKLLVTNVNSYFIKLLIGSSKKKIMNQPIINVLPTFCRDIKVEKSKKHQWQSSIMNDMNLRHWCGKNESDQEWCENSLTEESDNLTSRSFSFTNDSPRVSEWSEKSYRMDPEKDSDIKTLFTHMKITKVPEDQANYNSEVSFQNGISHEDHSCSDGQINRIVETNVAEQKDKIFELTPDPHQNFLVQEGKFLGLIQHSDGSLIDVSYQVKMAAMGEEIFYCVWLLANSFKFSETDKGSNSNMLSSYNSASFEDSLPKDSTCSGHCTKPSSASLISQCDENLTAGDYSRFYTNIRQIGKGAFGYVKMAFKNSDGLLVVTKFIKKQSVNIRSWVFHSNLNMMIPLEISLLTILSHPNIVRVLDVFHNDSFVQLVMEKHGAGFDLFEFINRGPQCDEKLKSYIFRQIISAVYYLDSLGILHRDLKDENVIINEKFEVKLIDFGSATFMPHNENFSKFYGTVEYCSPEVLLGNCYKGPELEIWALGVTLYVLTFNENPFCNIEEIIKGQFSIPFHITKELDDLLRQMLEKNVETRITIDRVVQHPWINQPVSIENYRFEEVVKCSDEEAYPPKYVHEINLEDLYGKDSRTYSNQLGDTNNSNSSLQNLTEIDDLDDNFQATEKTNSPSEFSGSKTNRLSILFSSTPMQSKKERSSKSSTAIPNSLENLLSLSDCGYDDGEGSYAERPLKNNYLLDFKDTSSSGKDFDGGDYDDALEKIRLKNSFLEEECEEEEYFNVNRSSESEIVENIKEVYELSSENERERLLGSENDSENRRCKPN